MPLYFKGFNRIKALFYKEFLQIIRDPSSILIAFVLPVILLFLFGYGLSLDADNIKTIIVLEDNGSHGRKLAQTFTNNSYFDTTITTNRKLAELEITEGRVRGMIVIPSNFSEKLEQSDQTAKIQIISDGSEPNTATFLEGYSTGVIQNWALQQNLENTSVVTFKTKTTKILAQPRFWFNSELLSRNFLLPGCMTMILSIIGTLLTALVVAREWERGTMESLLSTPIRPVELIISKLLPYFILGLGSLLISTLVARLLFDLPMRGSILALILTTTAFLLVSLLLGLLISTVSKNQFVAAQLSILLAFLPVSMLSGFVFEINSMPWFLQQVTRIVPARYYVAATQTIFLAGDIWPVLIPSTIILLVMALILLLITLRKSSKLLD